MPFLSLHPGQVVNEPAVARDERLGPGRLGLPHDAEAVLVGVETHDPVLPHPELLPASCKVQVLGREDQEAWARCTVRPPGDSSMILSPGSASS